MKNIIAQFKINNYEVFALKVLEDNIVYFICLNNKAILIDAGESKPILEFIDKNNIQLMQILITHNHYDHVGGCQRLLDLYGVHSRSPSVAEEEISILQTKCEVISTPGHSAIHKSFYFPELKIVFTGDLLINGGCGRVIDGTIEQLYNSLGKITSLPESTIVLGGHDYLKSNLLFSQSIKPCSDIFKKRLSTYNSDPQKALFMSIKNEISSNIFLNCESLEQFTELRIKKDLF
tara:strand:+ start:778 stop:1479 length:702 start_codon:yes stop_codon:yes gene_type:complete